MGMRRLNGKSIYDHMDGERLALGPTMPEVVEAIMAQSYGAQRLLCLLVEARRKKEKEADDKRFQETGRRWPAGSTFTEALSDLLNRNDAY
jgi:hypothetical protein